MNSNLISKIKKLLKSSKNIVIISHTNPDGDAVGSSLALYTLFKKLNYSVSSILPNNFPSFLSWMNARDEILICSKNPNKCISLLNNADMIFCLDFNSPERVDKLSDTLKNAKGIKILIDHHIEPDNTFDYILSDTKTSSTSELIYNFIEALGYKKLIDKSIAENLYVGICTDTGSYSYSCDYPETFRITAELIKLGINSEKIHHLIYDTFSENRMRLIGFCLSEKLVVLDEYKTAYISISKEDKKKFDFQVGDGEGIVNYPLSIKNIYFAVLLTEKDNGKGIRISFRSKGNFSVNDYANKYFEGGGHRNAAGGNSYVSLDETIKKFKELLPLYKDELNNLSL